MSGDVLAVFDELPPRIVHHALIVPTLRAHVPASWAVGIADDGFICIVSGDWERDFGVMEVCQSDPRHGWRARVGQLTSGWMHAAAPVPLLDDVVTVLRRAAGVTTAAVGS